ncbi:MAG: AAA family ATPase [Candidatus Electryonea clarkiae]|nr:AAA family ATPase [Candidatus Electryonea clarkiae]MDP8286224.1 AAA family ATPase [Candidatus Electryonea clarkiae]
MKVKKLEINQFRGINEMTLNFNDQVNVLVGVNGAGKSSILDALVIMTSRLIGWIYSQRSTGRHIPYNDITNGVRESVLKIGVEFEGKNADWVISRARRGVKRTTTSNTKQAKDTADLILQQFEKEENKSFPIIVYYSVHRSVPIIRLQHTKRSGDTQFDAYVDAFQLINNFNNFFSWFRTREDLENEAFRLIEGAGTARIVDVEYPDRQLETVRKAVTAMMPGYSDIKVRRKQPLQMTIEKNGKLFRIDQLSDGEKCLLALVGDLARRMAIANPALSNPLEGEGVVLIDEIDLHLHPAWQRMVIPNLTEIFANCQFIVSTHSPQVLGHVKPENIFLLHETDEGIKYEKPEASYGMSCDRIIEDLMGDIARPEEIDKKLENLFDFIERKELKEAKRLLKDIIDIDEMKPNAEPELIRAKLRIDRLETLGK